MPVEIIKDSLISITKTKLFDNQQQLRDALCHDLNHRTNKDNWNWHTKQPFQTDCLVNNERTFFNIMGQRRNGSGENEIFLVELKYVPVNIRNTPHDPPAFAYDVLKDCVKIELAIVGKATNEKRFSKISGLSIGITNHTRYWDNNGNYDNWASSFLRKINPYTNECLIFNGLMYTDAKNKLITIYRQRRCHISLGLEWQGEWIDLEGYHKGYKFLIINPKNNDFSYQHHALSSDTIPFLDPRAKQEFHRIKSDGYL